MIDYCPVCNRDTVHVIVLNDVFEHALECIECKTVWEAELSIEVIEIQVAGLRKKEKEMKH